jgi:hypothetical protein
MSEKSEGEKMDADNEKKFGDEDFIYLQTLTSLTPTPVPVPLQTNAANSSLRQDRQNIIASIGYAVDVIGAGAEAHPALVRTLLNVNPSATQAGILTVSGSTTGRALTGIQGTRYLETTFNSRAGITRAGNLGKVSVGATVVLGAISVADVIKDVDTGEADWLDVGLEVGYQVVRGVSVWGAVKVGAAVGAAGGPVGVVVGALAGVAVGLALDWARGNWGRRARK